MTGPEGRLKRLRSSSTEIDVFKLPPRPIDLENHVRPQVVLHAERSLMATHDFEVVAALSAELLATSSADTRSR